MFLQVDYHRFHFIFLFVCLFFFRFHFKYSPCFFLNAYVSLIQSNHHKNHSFHFLIFTKYCCCSVAKSCLILCNPMDCNRLGFPVFYSLLEFVQTHISDAIQPSHPLLQKGISTKCLLLRRLDEHTLIYEATAPHPFWKKWSTWSHLVWNWIGFFSHRHHSMCPGDYEVNWNNNNTCMGLLKLDNESKNRWNIL